MADSYSEITNHTARALARLKTQFQNSVEFKGLITALCVEVQAIETALAQLDRYLRDNAACAADSRNDALAKIGRLVGSRPQGGLTATQFSALIDAQVQVNASDGHLDQLIEIADLFLSSMIGNILYANDADASQLGPFPGGNHTATLTPDLPVAVNNKSVTPEALRNAIDLIRQATPAGNRTILTVPVFPTNDNDGTNHAIFFLDSTNTDGPERMVVSIDNPASVR